MGGYVQAMIPAASDVKAANREILTKHLRGGGTRNRRACLDCEGSGGADFGVVARCDLLGNTC